MRRFHGYAIHTVQLKKQKRTQNCPVFFTVYILGQTRVLRKHLHTFRTNGARCKIIDKKPTDLRVNGVRIKSLGKKFSFLFRSKSVWINGARTVFVIAIHIYTGLCVIMHTLFSIPTLFRNSMKSAACI